MGKKKKPSSPSSSSNPSKSHPVSFPDPPGSVESLSSDEAIDQDKCAPSCEDSPASGALSAQASPTVDASSDLSGPAESENLASVTVTSVTTPRQSNLDASTVKTTSASDLPAESTVPVKATNVVAPVTLEEPGSPATDRWSSLFKGTGKPLQRKGTAFQLPSGEACVQIPNSVIEKNKKSWECFIIGQFYSDPPTQGTLHNIVNGIWSRQYRDISVSKMDGFTFLFRIPNAATRRRVIKQRLWQIEGQTMFVADWEPGVTPDKPELTSAPIWLELRDVPLQFFNKEALEHIAGLVGLPRLLHPSTANKSDLEVAKVLTLIDPRKPLPEAVNAQFQSGEVRRIRVSSPWMPPVCMHCKEIGHILKHCRAAPILCSHCNSRTHKSENCTKANPTDQKRSTSRRSRARSREETSKQPIIATGSFSTKLIKYSESSLGKAEETDKEECGGSRSNQTKREGTPVGLITSDKSSNGVQTDSSDLDSSEAEAERFQAEQADDFTLVGSKKKKKKKNKRGKGPNSQ